MNRGSKVLVGVILFLIVLSVSATFYKAVIQQDFEIIIVDHGEEEVNEQTSETPEEGSVEEAAQIDAEPNTENQYEE